MSSSDPSTPALEISPLDVARTLHDAAGKVCLLDVREPGEYQIVHLDGARLVPMGSVPAALSELEGFADEARLVVYCHHGVRSLHVVAWLRSHGVENCVSMAGGIDRWSLEVDPSLPRY